MPTLNWIGKEKVVNHHLDIPYHTLNQDYVFDNGVQSPEGKSDNKIIHADNLLALKSLLPEYEGRIKCIYIDPPYNTGNEGWVYNDNVSDPRFKKWLGQVVGKEAEDLTRHDKWLCMMYPRLKLLHKLLAEDGVIFISLDEIEITHLRCIMDEIFGENNFIAQLTLLCNPKGRSQDKYFSTNHEYISVYSKKQLPKDSFSVTKDEELISKEYKLKDQYGRFRLLELRNTHREFNKQNRPNLFYSFFVNPVTEKVSLERNSDNIEEVQPLWPDGFEGCWTWGKELAEKDNHLLVAQKTRGNWKIYRKSYSSLSDGENVQKKLFTIWQDSKFYTEKGQITFGEIFPGLNKNDFPQPKSVNLIAEILKTSTKNEDIILDSFAGSGTTAHSVLNLNKHDGGNRKFILIEMEKYAETITAERVKRVIKGYGDTEGTGGAFSFYTLGERVLDDEQNLNPNLSIEKIHSYIWYSETHQPYTQLATAAGYLGKCKNTGFYFYYQPNEVTILDDAYLMNVTEACGQYVVYADVCLLSEKTMLQHNIIFKKIPRDISKL